MAEENQKPVEAKPQQHQPVHQKPAFKGKQKQKEKEPAIKLDGTVVEALKGSFKVKIPSPNPKAEPPHMFVLAHLAGKLRKHSIKIVPGDIVTVEISPYDITKARITYRK